MNSVNPPVVSPVNSKAPMVLTTLLYRGANIRFVQFPQADGAPTHQDPKAWLVIDDDVLDSFGFNRPFRKLIKGMTALVTTTSDGDGDDADQTSLLIREIHIEGEEVDIISFTVLSYLEERFGNGKREPALRPFLDYVFTEAWTCLTGGCVCTSLIELDANGDIPRPKLPRTSASDGIETLEDAIQRIEELALAKAAVVDAVESAYRTLAGLRRR